MQLNGGNDAEVPLFLAYRSLLVSSGSFPFFSSALLFSIFFF